MNTVLHNKVCLRSNGLLICFWALLMLMAGCNGSKSLAKKGTQLQEAGLHTDAALFYYNSLLKNANNVDARIGLARSGQQVLNDKLDAFSMAFKSGEHRRAVYAYREAEAYREKIDRLGVKINSPDYFKTDYTEVKHAYLKELYNEGNDLLADKQFNEANEKFQELGSLEPNYKDVGDLKNTSLNEPVYMQATALFDQASYRKAYAKFNEIYKSDPSYKDVAVLREECLDLGKYPVTIAPFENVSSHNDIEKRVKAFVITSLLAVKDPFLKVVERDNIEVILNQQRLNLSGVVDERTAAQVGNLLGTKAIITGTLMTYSAKTGRMRMSEKKAFEAYQVKLYNKETEKNYFETRYKPVVYKEYYNENKLEISFQYKAISLETGEILFSEVIHKNLDSEIHYATYPGEVNALFPAGTNGVITSGSERNALRNMVRSNRELKTIDQLANDAFQAVANSLAGHLRNYLADN